MPYRRICLAFLILIVLGSSGCGGDAGSSGVRDGSSQDPEVQSGSATEAARHLRPHEGTSEDWAIFQEKVQWAWELGLDTLPMGEAMVQVGLSFVGTPYAPGTLEVPGSEDLVVNFQELDCVTFVENVLAMARFLRLADPQTLPADPENEALYRRILAQIRYRGGRVEGYPSRLHYFSDWIRDNEGKGLVLEVTLELGGVEDHRALEFMSAHPESYRQLADASNLQAIREREVYLSNLTRYRIPEGEIPIRSSGIRDGDIIAATSTLDGLDVAHTGLALWRDGVLYLLHAPLVGDFVEVSSQPLADRILRLQSQDGIRVVRPLEVPEDGTGPGGASP